MAIYAEISHKSIRASVTHRKLDLSASLVPALGNQISFSKLVGTANWRNLYMFDVHVNAERTIFPLYDLFEIQESTIIDFSKVNADQFGFVSSPVFSTTKAASDSTSMLDVASFDVTKVAAELVSLSEAQVFSLDKSLSDSVGFSENVQTLLTYIRSFSHSTSLSDLATLATTKGLSDSLGFSESQTFSVGAELSDSASLSDAMAFDVGAFADSSVSFTDQQLISRDPYNFVFSESGGVLSVTGAPTDTFGVTDSITNVAISAVLQDYYTLDDFAQVEKDVTGVKGNVVGMTEVIEFDHMITSGLLNKSLVGNMVLNA
jgi:hypothetical protein